MNAIAIIPPTTQAKHIYDRLMVLSNKYRSVRESKTAMEFRDMATLVKELENSLRIKESV